MGGPKIAPYQNEAGWLKILDVDGSIDVFDSARFGKDIYTLDVENSVARLGGLIVVNGCRKRVVPPKHVCDATLAWLNSFHGSIDWTDFILRMFSESESEQQSTG